MTEKNVIIHSPEASMDKDVVSAGECYWLKNYQTAAFYGCRQCQKLVYFHRFYADPFIVVQLTVRDLV
jgi:hypothetical protein